MNNTVLNYHYLGKKQTKLCPHRLIEVWNVQILVSKESLRLGQGFPERIDTIAHPDIGVIRSGGGHNLKVDESRPHLIDNAIDALFECLGIGEPVDIGIPCFQSQCREINSANLGQTLTAGAAVNAVVEQEVDEVGWCHIADSHYRAEVVEE